MKRIAGAAFAVVLCGYAGAAEAQSNYGGSVALVDGTVFVAQPANVVGPGRVYAYQSANGAWAEIARLTAADAATGDGFGYAIAADGSLLIVGQPARAGGRGSAFIFEQRGGQWQQMAELAPAAAAAADSIGLAVAVHGDVAVARDQHHGANSAYVFRRSGTPWTQETVLTGSDAAAGDGFGRAVAVNGSRVIVGAPLQAENRGAAYLFDRNGDAWSETAKLLARTVTPGSPRATTWPWPAPPVKWRR